MIAWRCKSSIQPDGGEGLAKRKGVAVRWGLKEARSKATTDLDLEKCLDRVNHDLLLGRVAKRVQDKRVLKLIRAYLTAGVMEHGLVSATEEGTPQGGPLSPLLSNILLTDLYDGDTATYATPMTVMFTSKARVRDNA